MRRGAKFGGGSVTSKDSSLTTRRSIQGCRPTRTRAAKFPGSRQRRGCRFSGSARLAPSPVPRRLRRKAEPRIDLSVDEKLHWRDGWARDPIDVLGGVKADVGGHGRYEDMRSSA